MGDQPYRIVGIGGSLRAASSSLSALRVALGAAASAGAHVELIDVGRLDVPLYDPVAERGSPDTAHLVEVAGVADAMIWSSPLYHGSVSGAFKNVLDWLQLLAHHDPPFLAGKPVGLIATSAGTQSLQAINTMEHVVRALRGWTVPYVVPIGRAYQAFGPDGAARDSAVSDQLTKLGHEVVAALERLAPAPK